MDQNKATSADELVVFQIVFRAPETHSPTYRATQSALDELAASWGGGAERVSIDAFDGTTAVRLMLDFAHVLYIR